MFLNILVNNIDTIMLSRYSENAPGAVGNLLCKMASGHADHAFDTANAPTAKIRVSDAMEPVKVFLPVADVFG